jgi:ATP-dependent 26S proteasome regulatory subunit
VKDWTSIRKTEMHLILKKKKKKKKKKKEEEEKKRKERERERETRRRRRRYFVSNTLKVIQEDHALLFAQSRNSFGPSYLQKRELTKNITYLQPKHIQQKRTTLKSIEFSSQELHSLGASLSILEKSHFLEVEMYGLSSHHWSRVST